MPSHEQAPARTHAQLAIADVEVERGGRPVLKHLSVAVNPGTRLGVVGENGRGKSTLLAVLSGAIAPDAGIVQRVGSIGIAEQEITVDAVRTVGELIDIELAAGRAALKALDEATAALAAGHAGADSDYSAALDAVISLDAWDADRRVTVALEALGAVTDRGRRLVKMSVGERYRVRLACLLGAAHDFLLLDEPNNHLDQAGLDFLTDALRSTDAGVVLVSHDRALLTDVAHKILDLDPTRDGRPRLYGDGFAGYASGRKAELARWEQDHARHQAEQSRLADDLSAAQNRLHSGWRPPKGTGKHQRATRAPALVRSVNRRLEDLHAHEAKKPVRPLRFQMPQLPVLPNAVLLHADGVTVTNRLTTPISAELTSGDRLLITGPNGAGKSTLLAVLAGRVCPDSGGVGIAPDARLGYVTQESQSSEPATVRQVYERRRQRLLEQGALPADIVSLRSLGLFPTPDLSRPVAELSMGQQRRLDLALSLAGSPHVLLLDEPTNHLSLALVDELTEAFDLTPAAVVVVTHDRQLRRDLRHWPTLQLPRRAPSTSARCFGRCTPRDRS